MTHIYYSNMLVFLVERRRGPRWLNIEYKVRKLQTVGPIGQLIYIHVTQNPYMHVIYHVRISAADKCSCAQRNSFGASHLRRPGQLSICIQFLTCEPRNILSPTEHHYGRVSYCISQCLLLSEFRWWCYQKLRFHTDPLQNSLNASEQREFASRMERKQLKEFMSVRYYLIPSPDFAGLSTRQRRSSASWITTIESPHPHFPLN